MNNTLSKLLNKYKLIKINKYNVCFENKKGELIIYYNDEYRYCKFFGKYKIFNDHIYFQDENKLMVTNLKLNIFKFMKDNIIFTIKFLILIISSEFTMILQYICQMEYVINKEINFLIIAIMYMI
jgi:hypothetical protein